jgi:hypothetical protein
MNVLLTMMTVSILLAFGGNALALEVPEKARVEAFLQHLSTKTDIVFVRNGSRYPVSKAVSHLRTKLSRAADRLYTAEEFIDNVASRSTMSGRPYSVILPDGKEVPAGPNYRDLLRESDGMAGGGS